MARGIKKSKLLCPEGHQLPHVLENGAQCTPVFCAVENMATDKGKAIQESVDEIKEEAIVMEKARRHASLQQGRKKLREKLVPRPENPDTKEAEEWAQKRVIEMLPDAVAEVEYQLKYGDDSARMAAARDILDANGMRRRDQLPQGGNTIVLHMGSVLPWQQQIQQTAAQVTIDAPKPTREIAAVETEAVRQRLPEQLRRPTDAAPGRGPSAEGADGQSDAAGVHQGPNES